MLREARRVTLAITALGPLSIAASGQAQTITTAQAGAIEATTLIGSVAAQQRTTTTDSSIRPFRVKVSDAALADLRRRIRATRWADKENVADASQGVQLATMKALARYWSTTYDWRKAEARLNALPQFVTNIDGLDIHFIHVRSRHANAVPMIVTHGWPGSIIEQLKIIGPLTDPTAYGGRPEDAFDVVIPSLPGYGFSGKPTSPGWGPARVARAWDVLMKRLGYTRYVAQGGDIGAIVSEIMGRLGLTRAVGHPHQPVPHRAARAQGRDRHRRAGAAQRSRTRKRPTTSGANSSRRPVSATSSRWSTGRRRSATAWPIHPSVSRRG